MFAVEHTEYQVTLTVIMLIYNREQDTESLDIVLQYEK